ncbi:hypothetical protein Syun_003025 [Stephania yunnanensis]|uniref:WEB family protein n=1 Tax=Stephania yunnanensis TaxID=152371 RepID=A0AAP0L1Y6_9MAGN
MEDQQQEKHDSCLDHENANVDDELHDNPSVDTSRPFRSVKEAVAVFGERLLANGILSPRPFTMPKHETPQKPSSSPIPPRELSMPSTSVSPSSTPLNKSTIYNIDHDHDKELALANMLKRLEAELEDTKKELNVLKERESETEIALASLNAELHKNMSKTAKAEAVAAAEKALVLATKSSTSLVPNNRDDINNEDTKRRATGPIARMDQRSSLAQLLSLSQDIGAVRKQNKMMKKKPIVPILDIFSSKKKSSPTNLHNPSFAASQMYFS